MEKITMAELAKKAGVSTATLRKFLKHERVRNRFGRKNRNGKFREMDIYLKNIRKKK